MKLIIYNFIILSILEIAAFNLQCTFAQELSVKASFQGTPANGFFAFDPSFKSENRLDFNRDGITDQSFIDSKDKSIVIFNGADHQQKWIVPLGNYFDGKFLRADAFYEMDGDTATTEIVIAKREGNRFWSPVILRVDRASPNLTEMDELLASPGYFLIGINDIDQDGKDDIIVADTTLKMIEILGY